MLLHLYTFVVNTKSESNFSWPEERGGEKVVVRWNKRCRTTMEVVGRASQIQIEVFIIVPTLLYYKNEAVQEGIQNLAWKSLASI